jgi:hypothetical protein
MLRLFSHPRFLAIYSGLLTVAFVLTAALLLSRLNGQGARSAYAWTSSPVSAAEEHNPSYDQITVHRINIVEPDGTPRLIIADKAEFPGEFFKGKELPRPDRRDSAGMLFMNDEGTENGGLLFGGYQSADGKLHSFGHLSFDEYEQDQTLALETDQDGDNRETGYQINDDGPALFTPEVAAELQKLRAMPRWPGKRQSICRIRRKIPHRAAHARRLCASPRQVL